MITPRRRAEYAEILRCTTRWASTRPDIRAVGLAGSWARGKENMSSDIDLVVLTLEPESYVLDSRWVSEATGRPGQARIVRTRKWGPLTERRVQLPSGLLVEYGFAPLTWARTDSLDPGTAGVVADGFEVLFDPDRALARLVTRVLE